MARATDRHGNGDGGDIPPWAIVSAVSLDRNPVVFIVVVILLLVIGEDEDDDEDDIVEEAVPITIGGETVHGV